MSGAGRFLFSIKCRTGDDIRLKVRQLHLVEILLLRGAILLPYCMGTFLLFHLNNLFSSYYPYFANWMAASFLWHAPNVPVEGGSPTSAQSACLYLLKHHVQPHRTKEILIPFSFIVLQSLGRPLVFRLLSGVL